MRTFKMIISPTKNKKDAAFCQYFKTNTADSKCMYNTANFYIRNTMTGLKKSPEERTPLETEVLHYVFTGIQKANEVIGQKNMKKKFAELKLAEVGGMQSAVAAFSIVSHEPFQYPTAKKWFLSYGTLDAIFKFTDNPIYRRMNSQVNQNAIRKAVAAWQGYFESLKAYKKNPAGFTGKPKIPGYKQDEEYIAWFSKQVAKLKEEDGRYYIQFVNNPDRFEIGKASLYGDLKYVKTEVKAMYGKYYILITFDDKIAEVKVPENPKFITILKTVASKCGIAVVIREESYTSQASLLDMDDIPTYKKGKNKKYAFSGKRIHRGLYRSKNGTLLNADINGAANILRKEYPNAFDGIKDFTYLCITTISISYKDLYKNAKACAGRPKQYKYHKSGRYTVVRHMERSHKKCEYRKLWGKGKFGWRPDKNKQDTQQEKAA